MKFSLATLALFAAPIFAAPANPPNTGEIVTDLGPEVNQTLAVTGTDAQQLLVQLSPEVAALVDSLGLASVGEPLGSVVATASSVGDLLKELGPNTEGVVVVTGEDAKILLVQLSPSVASLVAGLLPPLAVPVGAVVTTVGDHVKRATGTGKLLADIGTQVDGALTIAGPATSTLLIQLSPELTALVSGLGLPPVGTLVGSVVASASSVGDLLTELGPGLDGLLIVVENGAEYLLIQLSPVVSGLLSGLGLPALGVPLGEVVDEVAYHL